MIIDSVHALSLAVTIRHSDQCNGIVTIRPTVDIEGSPRKASLVVGCSKCKTAHVSHVAQYSADFDLLNIADRLAALHEQPYLKAAEQEELQQLVTRLRARGESL